MTEPAEEVADHASIPDTVFDDAHLVGEALELVNGHGAVVIEVAAELAGEAVGRLVPVGEEDDVGGDGPCVGEADGFERTGFADEGSGDPVDDVDAMGSALGALVRREHGLGGVSDDAYLVGPVEQVGGVGGDMRTGAEHGDGAAAGVVPVAARAVVHAGAVMGLEAVDRGKDVANAGGQHDAASCDLDAVDGRYEVAITVWGPDPSDPTFVDGDRWVLGETGDRLGDEAL